MNRRAISLFRILAKSDGYVSSEQLCESLDIRPRTLRDDLKKYRDVIERKSGAKIESKTNQGYRLVIGDEEKYYSFMKSLIKEEASHQFLMPVLQEDRVNFIIRYFLGRNDYIKSEDLADELYVSRSTFSTDLRLVKDQLSYFHLSLESKVGFGLKIVGDELNIRLCMSQYFFHIENHDIQQLELSNIELFDQENKRKVAEILYRIIKEAKFKLTDFGFQNLVIHILIAIYRMNERTFFDDHGVESTSLSSKVEWSLAEKIALDIKKSFNVEFPKKEIAYITIHLLGKKVLEKDDNQVISADTLNLVREVYDEISMKFGYEFYSDIELFTMLTLHIQPMLNRIKYGLKLHNPLIERIKSENPLAFEISVLTGQCIGRKLDREVDENELGYLALHFQLAIQRNQKKTKKRILVICASGAGTSQILMYKVSSIFKDEISEIVTINAFQLRDINQVEYDLILTTIPLDVHTIIPVIRVQYFLDDTDVMNVKKILLENNDEEEGIKKSFRKSLYFTNIQIEDKHELISFLCQQMSSVVKLPDDFESSVIEREELASTALGHGIAVPHPMKLMLDETVVSVCHLSRPIKWGGEEVSLVLLLGIKKNSDEAFTLFNKILASLINNLHLINRLKADTSYENFMSTIEAIYSVQTKRRNDSIFE